MAYGKVYMATDMTDAVWWGLVADYSDSRIIIEDGVRQTTYRGDFSYTYWGEVFGSLRGIEQTYRGKTQFEAGNFSVDANDAYTAIQIHNDAQALAAMILKGKDKLFGSDESDVLFGYAGADVIKGNGGKDRLHGDSGKDVLKGGSGGDKLFGGGGRDELLGGLGQDKLTGDGGSDRFIFKSEKESARGSKRDVILDFERGKDVIVLAAIDAKENTKGDQSFDFIGRDAFSGHAGELRFKKEVLKADVDGDGRSDFEIEVSGISHLGADDLIL